MSGHPFWWVIGEVQRNHSKIRKNSVPPRDPFRQVFVEAFCVPLWTKLLRQHLRRAFRFDVRIWSARVLVAGFPGQSLAFFRLSDSELALSSP